MPGLRGEHNTERETESSREVWVCVLEEGVVLNVCVHAHTTTSLLTPTWHCSLSHLLDISLSLRCTFVISLTLIRFPSFVSVLFFSFNRFCWRLFNISFFLFRSNSSELFQCGTTLHSLPFVSTIFPLITRSNLILLGCTLWHYCFLCSRQEVNLQQSIKSISFFGLKQIQVLPWQ